jgi:hypothetical protein
MLDTMHSIAFEPTPAVTKIRADIPYSLQKVVDRCLEKKPEDRYQQIRDTVSDLKSVKRQIDSGVSGGIPVTERVKSWYRGLSTRGLVWALVLGAIVGGGGIAFLFGGKGPSVPALFMVAAVGLYVFRRFRNRGQREIRRFVKKASSLREVRLVAFHRGQFTIITEKPTAKTYVKLNALLTTANERLFHGDPMTMIVREDVQPEERTRILSSPGVQFVRDDAKRPALAARS